MRISIVTSFFLPVPPVAGGAMEKVWFRLAREFAREGHEITLFSRAWPGFAGNETIDGISMVRLPGFVHRRRTWINLALDVLWARRVARRLPGADVVVCNTVTLPVYLSLRKRTTGKIVAVLARMSKGHGRFYGGVDRIVAISEAVRSQLVAENSGLAPRARVHPMPIDWPLHHAHSRKSSPPDPLQIGFVGRLNPEKGVGMLLEAAERLAARSDLPPWRMRIVGPQRIAEGGGGAEYIETLRRIAERCGQTVSIEPPVYDLETLAQVYGGLDVFCYPSLAEKGEGFGVAPIEAMAAGAVPVVSALDCFQDFMRNGENGLVFDHRVADRSDRLAEALGRLLSDSGLRRRLAERASSDSRRFDYPAVAAELLADFGALAASSAGH